MRSFEEFSYFFKIQLKLSLYFVTASILLIDSAYFLSVCSNCFYKLQIIS